MNADRYRPVLSQPHPDPKAEAEMNRVLDRAFDAADFVSDANEVARAHRFGHTAIYPDGVVGPQDELQHRFQAHQDSHSLTKN